MQGSQHEVLLCAQQALQQGISATLVSVANTYGTSPRPVGSIMVVCGDGRFAGSVSGGCIEEDLLQRLVEQPPQQCTLERFGETAEERERLKLPCGGSLDLLLEPLRSPAEVEPLLQAIEQRRTLTRHVELASGVVTLEAYRGEHKAELTSQGWTNIFGPVWRLLIVGAGETSAYLAELARALEYRVLVADPRPEYRAQWRPELGQLCDGYPDDVLRDLQPDPRTAVVTLSHDPKLDDLALLEALQSEAFFIGALGSVRTNQGRRQRLQKHFGITDAQLQRLHGPVGLPIGSKTPMEIALSVAAQLTAARHGLV
ncbi:XdhC family protein [Pseudomaricurvus sp. HS19]|uniref:XdhC family protein n=1 Tax=Pseudomaricurvus sp. HS19 TaxID=2692626 RepID=UPI00136BE40E|nr:hypothetical protein [Pseudomaricurvus sp. HS19]